MSQPRLTTSSRNLTLPQIETIQGLKGTLSEGALAKTYRVSEDDILAVWSGSYVPEAETRGRSKITDIDARLILAAKGHISAKELSAHYGLSEAAIYNIWSGDSWRELPRADDVAFRGKGWPVRMLALLLERERLPQELANELALSLPTVYRGIEMLRTAGFDVVATGGSRLNERRFSIKNARLTSPLMRPGSLEDPADGAS